MNFKGSIRSEYWRWEHYCKQFTPDGKNKSEFNSGVGSITLYIPESSKATIIATTSDFKWGDSEKGSDSIKSEFESSNVTQEPVKGISLNLFTS